MFEHQFINTFELFYIKPKNRENHIITGDDFKPRFRQHLIVSNNDVFYVFGEFKKNGFGSMSLLRRVKFEKFCSFSNVHNFVNFRATEILSTVLDFSGPPLSIPRDDHEQYYIENYFNG